MAQTRSFIHNDKFLNVTGKNDMLEFFSKNWLTEKNVATQKRRKNWFVEKKSESKSSQVSRFRLPSSASLIRTCCSTRWVLDHLVPGSDPCDEWEFKRMWVEQLVRAMGDKYDFIVNFKASTRTNLGCCSWQISTKAFSRIGSWN